MINEVLRWRGIGFRDFEPSDRDALLDYWTREAYWRHLPHEIPTPGSTEALLGRTIRDRDRAPRTNHFLAVIEAAAGRLVGEACLDILSLATGSAEIGWVVHHDLRRRGLGTTIGAALLDFGFGVIGLHRIQAQCTPENVGSRRVMERIGMREEGLFRDDAFARGRRWSTVRYAVLSTNRPARSR